jgi:multicomponent Na+:H+ antiporter subunit E
MLRPSTPFAGRAAAWLLPLALAWWALAEGRPGSWSVGVPVVVLAAVVAAWAVPWPRRWARPAALLRFAVWFLRESVKGGVDVARRALSPAMPLSPGFAEVRTRLPEGGARVLFADTMSLLPGTLTIDLVEDRVLVHALDAGPSLQAGAGDVERRVADLLGLPAPGARP